MTVRQREDENFNIWEELAQAAPCPCLCATFAETVAVKEKVECGGI
jgi:hypothetical protein